MAPIVLFSGTQHITLTEVAGKGCLLMRMAIARRAMGSGLPSGPSMLYFAHHTRGKERKVPQTQQWLCTL
jgi:hypothetical protein